MTPTAWTSRRSRTGVLAVLVLAGATAVAVAPQSGADLDRPTGAATRAPLPVPQAVPVAVPETPAPHSSEATRVAATVPQPPTPTQPTPAQPTPAQPAPKPPPPSTVNPPPQVRPSARDQVITTFASQHGFRVSLGVMPGYRGVAAYATTDMRTCQVWVSDATTYALALDVVRHELIHVLACRAGVRVATDHFEHVADAGAALLGARRAFYGPFSAADSLEARRLLNGMVR